MAKILIVGCGSIGFELATVLITKGHHVTALKRHLADPILNSGMDYFSADIRSATDLKHLPKDFEQIFFIVSPDQRTETAYRAIYQTGLDNLLEHFAGQMHVPHWFFVSSSSVYGQTDGAWVDESSPAEPKNITSQLIRDAELKLLLSTQAKHTIVRLSGIYGPGREWLIRKTQQIPALQKHPPYYTNRIHQRDCVGILSFLLEQRLQGVSLQSCYLASDDNPATLWDVVSWLATQLHITQPREKPGETGMSMNKRCCNKRLKELGYQFQYPDYKQGYLSLI